MLTRVIAGRTTPYVPQVWGHLRRAARLDRMLAVLAALLPIEWDRASPSKALIARCNSAVERPVMAPQQPRRRAVRLHPGL